MSNGDRGPLALLLTVGVVAPAAIGLAQQEPVATMFREDLKRGEALALSFLPIELPAAGAAAPLHVYLSAGDLERAFDTPALRPDAAIVPTNNGLVVTAASPTSHFPTACAGPRAGWMTAEPSVHRHARCFFEGRQ